MMKSKPTKMGDLSVFHREFAVRLNEFAAAFLVQTEMPANEAILVMESETDKETGEFKLKYYFERKEMDDV